MSSSRTLGSAAVDVAERVFGRRQVVRAARFIWLRARRDGANDMASNGELLVQRALVGAAPGSVVLDVGAHHGEWAMSFLQATRGVDLRVYCFEPARATYVGLESAMRGLAVQLRNTAMGDSAGTATLGIVHEGAGSNSLVAFYGTEIQGQEVVPVTTVDAFCDEEGVDAVALLKIDAEGFDLRVLRGATSLLTRQAVGLVQFEYNHRWVHDRAFLKDAFDLLEPLGYRLGKATPDGIEVYGQWHPELETFREANYVAFPNSARPSVPTIAWWGP